MLVSTGQKQMHGTNSPIRIDFGPQYRGSMTGVIEAIIGAVASVRGINGTLASTLGITEAIIGAVASIAPSPHRAGD